MSVCFCVCFSPISKDYINGVHPPSQSPSMAGNIWDVSSAVLCSAC